MTLRAGPAGGLWPGPWSAEDGGPARLQAAACSPGLALQPGERLRATVRRAQLSTMTVLGAPGEVYLLTHTALRGRLGLPTTARVERLDPRTLRPRRRSPRLAGGPMWPGGLAVHANGSLVVVYGRHAHRLDRDCQPTAQLRLPVDEAHNGFVVLANGRIVTKNLSTTTPARLTVIDADRFEPVGPGTVCPEPSIARLSCLGNTVYVVGVRSIFRLHWDDASQALRLDPDWRFDYIGATAQTHGWDVVLDGRNAWFMDNGAHRYVLRMTGNGVGRGANRLLRVSLRDARDHGAWPVSGLPGGSITNPPLVDPARRIVVAFDSANRVLQAWRIEDGGRRLAPLWRHAPMGCASHLLLYPDTGELVVNDHRRWCEEVVMLDIASGAERGRVRLGGPMQGVVFPSVGWERDFYWSSMGLVARVFVA